MGRNIELKAHLLDWENAQVIAKELATDPLVIERQTDTYFRCERGRLKLREIEGREAQLVWYEREDQAQAKASDYVLVAASQPALLKRALTESLGVWVVVEKEGKIYLHHNVRIHLDEVRGLGRFLEFEAVLEPGDDVQRGEAQVAALSEAFKISPSDLIDCSYSDMLNTRANTRSWGHSGGRARDL